MKRTNLLIESLVRMKDWVRVSYYGEKKRNTLTVKRKNDKQGYERIKEQGFKLRRS